jgi:DHA2 family multidrug resistance protein
MVILSTVSLSSINPAQMTAAAGLYTLVRRVSGNIACAVLSTLIERRAQIHRVELVGNITNLSPALRHFDRGAAGRLMAQGYAPPTFRMRELALVRGILNRQSTMMAYNDVWRLLASLFIFALPLTLLLPRHGIPAEERALREP